METIKIEPNLPPTHRTDVGGMGVFGPETFVRSIEGDQSKKPDVMAQEAIGHTATKTQTEVIPPDKSDS